MWYYQCQHTNRNGELCKRPSKWAVWTFGWEGERFSSATWVEACGVHYLEDAIGIVSILETRKLAKS